MYEHDLYGFLIHAKNVNCRKYDTVFFAESHSKSPFCCKLSPPPSAACAGGFIVPFPSSPLMQHTTSVCAFESTNSYASQYALPRCSSRPTVYTYHQYPRPIPRIPSERLKIREAIDQNHGVYRAILIADAGAASSDTTVVVKKIPAPTQQSEASLMQQVCHRHVVQLLGVCSGSQQKDDCTDDWLVMEQAN